MKATPAAIGDVLVVEPRVFGDDRGFFYESFNARQFKALTGLEPNFVQDPEKSLDASRLSALGWKVKVPLREGISRAYQQYLRSIP